MYNREVIIKAPLNPFTGYGKDSFGLARAMRDAGWIVYFIPTSVAVPVPPDIAVMLTKAPSRQVDLLINHVDPDSIGLTPAERHLAATNIAWSMWEYTDMSPAANRDSLTERLKPFDQVLMYDPVAVEAFRPYIHEAQSLKVLQGGYESDFWKEPPGMSIRDWNSPMNWIMVGEGNYRKNPWVLLEAFQQFMSDIPDAEVNLHLKTLNMVFHPTMENVFKNLKIHYEVWSDPQLRSFYHQSHVIWAPSRGEGKNLPCLEAGTGGCTIAATNWGGMAQWLDSSYAYPMDYTVKTFEPHTAEIAEVSAETVYNTMVEIYNNRPEAERRAEHAKNVLPLMLDWRTVVERFTYLTGV